ncbi:hypothetical protein E3Q23_00112 [Wallemia mellicola]|uniref:SAC domain-containing protein n=1 Tax=Wallemia mellicola TaxID=1708541 RepID=A0A4T0M966_9BASI|nr:hypothetical protein E3Q23_00112 [Wallemia mellicola]TIB89466.1 hypothetical protein E3Q21_00565 [Wallemia mellicola]TIB91830.1 hypothetical protein E3Q20_00551 [Wallemia mellicola]TIB94799.1 hypothetical protein E3Q19_00154 [Wallemia mellicola]TIC05060.1 hypothetical protein E3Q17_00117 [Wallemia mellicola]
MNFSFTQTVMIYDQYKLYENKYCFIIIKSNQSDNYNKLIKISKSLDLQVEFDDNVYNNKDINQLLKLIEIDNGSLSKVTTFYGLVGFIKFTKYPYMIIITKRSPVGLLGGHYIYHIDDVLFISLSPKKLYLNDATESKLLNTFKQVDLSKNFYFSYSYDLTSSLYNNLNQIKTNNNRYIWNHNLIKDYYSQCIPIIHGFVDQSKLLVYGRVIHVTLIARRSRHFAGPRYLKRGINIQGNVANEVESEQIVSDSLTTPFKSKHAYNGNLNPNFTSFLQYRGSIPLFWSQDPQMGIKPMINVAPNDPYYRQAALHFKNLFRRYNTPIYILNLVKSRERIPRESKLLDSYDECVNQLNQFLDGRNKLRLTSWDMSRASKTNQDVIGFLEKFANDAILETNFFHTKYNKAQNGIIRTNCVDCLDRTNAAQFVIGKVAFGYQLHALGIIDKPMLDHDTDAVNMLTEMYHDHGDTIALQYGGSALVNRVETYRKINHWNSHSRDVVENIKRYYANSLLDADKQAAIDLFLGQSPPSSMESLSDIPIPTDSFFKLDNDEIKVEESTEQVESNLYHDYWKYFYRPTLFTSLERHFSTNMNSTLKYLPRNLKNRKNMSPFHTIKTSPNTPTRPFAPVRRWMSLQSIPSTRRNSSIGTISEVDSVDNNSEKDYESTALDVEEMIRERMQDLGFDQQDIISAVDRTIDPEVNEEDIFKYEDYTDYENKIFNDIDSNEYREYLEADHLVVNEAELSYYQQYIDSMSY